MAIVLSTDQGMLVHQSSLLKAIRTVYNVFLLSNDGANQVVAQGGLTQLVHHVFGRVIRPDVRSSSGMSGRRMTVGENEARRLEESRSATPAPPSQAEQSGGGEKLTL
jgi:brefeldin A-inhibited guanine nucleotide-exchange protein